MTYTWFDKVKSISQKLNSIKIRYWLNGDKVLYLNIDLYMIWPIEYPAQVPAEKKMDPTCIGRKMGVEFLPNL